MNERIVEKLMTQLSKITSQFDSQQLRKNFTERTRDCLKNGLNDLNIIDRSEFDAQSKVLHRLQDQVSQLESTLSTLEKEIETLRDHKKG